MNNDLKAVFREGALEFLQELEQALLHLEENPDNTGEIDRMFRVMHTIKGSAAMVELLRPFLLCRELFWYDPGE